MLLTFIYIRKFVYIYCPRVLFCGTLSVKGSLCSSLSSQVWITSLFMIIHAPMHIAFLNKKASQNLNQCIVLREWLGRMIFRSFWSKNSRRQHPLVKSLVFCGLISETLILLFSTTMHKHYSLKNTNMHVAHILW